MSIDAVFAQFFDDIPDPRQHAKIYYPFYDVLFLTVCAVIGGADGWEDIEDFGEVHLPWFQSKGLFKNGIPVHDTIARIISGIKPEPFQAAFVRWTQAINQHTEGALVAIDGKTLRSSYNREDRTSTIHMVSAYAAANKLVLGQIKTDAKSNEITAIPDLLALLDIKGCLGIHRCDGVPNRDRRDHPPAKWRLLVSRQRQPAQVVRGGPASPGPAGGYPIMRSNDDS